MTSEQGERNLALFKQRLEAGDKIKIVNDYYGGQWLEMRPRWQFWRRRRLRLSPQEMSQVKDELRGSRRQS